MAGLSQHGEWPWLLWTIGHTNWTSVRYGCLSTIFTPSFCDCTKHNYSAFQISGYNPPYKSHFSISYCSSACLLSHPSTCPSCVYSVLSLNVHASALSCRSFHDQLLFTSYMFIPTFMFQPPINRYEKNLPSHAAYFQIFFSVGFFLSLSGKWLHCYYVHILSLMCPQGILHTHKNQVVLF